MKYYVIAGEASGDIHAAKLLQGLKDEDAAAEFRFWGGDRMAEVAGVENMVSHYKDSAIMGFVAVAMNARKLLKRIKRCKEDIERYRPDVVILVDFAGFNLNIAKYAKSIGIKTFFYIAPKVWAWNEGRVKKIREVVDELFVIFPFEVEYFAGHGIRAHYHGNPLMDEIALSMGSVTSKEEFLKENNLRDKPVVALLAGSRVKEIKSNLPFMSDLAREFPDYQFVIAGVSWIDDEVYNGVIKAKASNLTLLKDKTYNILLHSEAAIVTSGTATLETALLDIPEFVCYNCSWFAGVMFRILGKVKHISLVNIILGREAVKELFSAKMVNVKNAKRELTAILPGGDKQTQIKRDYRELRDLVGEAGASARFARKMINILNKPKS